ncbi:thioredoxin domain-containing protein [Desulfitobacterium sp. AusDCA]|uniref:thioredoxin domain-containing protein n=1 Tax=Desulfitobacterium sp. AusDCA TaxID=3240383 RepID=UPI003DA6DCC7
MKLILQPGIHAPEFRLSSVNLDQEVSLGTHFGRYTILLFFGAELSAEIVNQLGEYQGRLQDFAKRKAQLIGISAASQEDLRRLAAEKEIGYPLVSLSLSDGIVSEYGVIGKQAVQPAVFVIDQEGLIRRVYPAEPEQGLVNPAMVLRALNNLVNIPKPSSVAVDDWQLGSPKAPVVLLEYGEYQCGHCRDLFHTITQLMPEYGNKIQFVFRHFPMRHLHPLAVSAAEAAEAAGAQGKYWEMHAKLFAADNALERENLIRYAQEIGLDVEKFTVDFDEHRFADNVQEDYRGGVAHKIKSPPTLFINGIFFDVPPTLENLRARIDALLSCFD